VDEGGGGRWTEGVDGWGAGGGGQGGGDPEALHRPTGSVRAGVMPSLYCSRLFLRVRKTEIP
jgi:hypothetical protein